MASKEEEPRNDPVDFPLTRGVVSLVPYPDSPVQEKPPVVNKEEEDLNPFVLFSNNMLLLFGSFISSDLDVPPLTLSRLLQACKRLNSVLKASMTQWKVSVLKRFIEEIGIFLPNVLKNNIGSPVRVSHLGVLFFSTFGRKFWEPGSLSSWIQQNKEFFLLGPEKGMLEVSISGEFER
jgi:hypothetical protein